MTMPRVTEGSGQCQTKKPPSKAVFLSAQIPWAKNGFNDFLACKEVEINGIRPSSFRAQIGKKI